MAADAARVAEPAAPPRRRTKTRSVPRRRLAGGVIWIGVIAVLLTGIVAVNVAVLRLNLRLDHLNDDKTQLRSEIADLRAKAADNSVPTTILTQAKLQGFHPANWTSTRFLDLPVKAR
jgi:hypothetical protein